MAKVARIYDDLDIMVAGSYAFENSHSLITRRVIDEDVLITISPDLQHGLANAFIEFLDVIFFIEAGGQDANGFL